MKRVIMTMPYSNIFKQLDISNHPTLFERYTIIRTNMLTDAQFVDAQRIAQLTHYMEALHARDNHSSAAASTQHTTILLNCYTQLNDTRNIERFVERIARHVDAQNRDDDAVVHARMAVNVLFTFD